MFSTGWGGLLCDVRLPLCITLSDDNSCNGDGFPLVPWVDVYWEGTGVHKLNEYTREVVWAVYIDGTEDNVVIIETVLAAASTKSPYHDNNWFNTQTAAESFNAVKLAGINWW